jgi:ABC-type phosphate transport system substrate-binding protein
VWRLIILLAGVTIWSSSPGSELYVVVNAQSPVNSLKRSEVIALFTGRMRSFPNDGLAQTYDQAFSSDTRASFYKMLTGMDLSRINSYWSRLQFTGQVQRPSTLADDSAVAARLGMDRQGISYMTQRPQDPGLRVVYVVREDDAEGNK